MSLSETEILELQDALKSPGGAAILKLLDAQIAATTGGCIGNIDQAQHATRFYQGAVNALGLFRSALTACKEWKPKPKSEENQEPWPDFTNRVPGRMAGGGI